MAKSSFQHKVFFALLTTFICIQIPQTVASSSDDDFCYGLKGGTWQGTWRQKSSGCAWNAVAVAYYYPNQVAQIWMDISNGQPSGYCENNRKLVFQGTCYKGWLNITEQGSGNQFEGTVDYRRMEILSPDDSNYTSNFKKNM